jgi:hypothetical protein
LSKKGSHDKAAFMADLNQQVPESVQKTVGHICGIISVFLATFCIWSIYRYFFNLNHPILVIVGISFMLSWFFGSTAIKLTTGSTRSIVSRFWQITFAAFCLLVVLLNFVAIVIYVLDAEFKLTVLLIWLVLSILVTSTVIAFLKFLQRR